MHDLVPKPELEALERERHQIVNNFAVSASAGYELAPLPALTDYRRASSWLMRLGPGRGILRCGRIGQELDYVFP